MKFHRLARNAIPPSVRQQIVVAYRSMGARKVAQAFGIAKPSVLNIVRAAGEPVRTPFYRVQA